MMSKMLNSKGELNYYFVDIDYYARLSKSYKKKNTTPQVTAVKIAKDLFAVFDDFMSRLELVKTSTQKAKNKLFGLSGKNCKKKIKIEKKAKTLLGSGDDCCSLAEYALLSGGRDCGGLELSDGEQNRYESWQVKKGFAKDTDVKWHRQSIGYYSRGKYYFYILDYDFLKCIAEWIKSGKADYREGGLNLVLKHIGMVFNGNAPYNERKYKELAECLACEKNLKILVQKGYIIANSDKTFDINYAVVIAPAIKAIMEYFEIMRKLQDSETTREKRIEESVAQQKEQARQAELDKIKSKGSVFDKLDKK